MRGAAAVVAVALVAGVSLLDARQPRSGIRRDVYITAVDQNGAYVTDLTAADLRVREAGQGREILRVEPAATRLKIALAVEESLTPDIAIRQAIATFIDRVQPAGDLALYVVGRRAEKRVQYTSSIMPLVEAINAFPARALYDGNLIEGVQEIAKEQRSIEGRRVIVALAMEIPQKSTVSADAVLNQLRDGGGIFYSATLTTFQESSGPASSGDRNLALENQVSGLERERLFTGATKQSGGLYLPSSRTQGFTTALHRVATDLHHQYLVSYVMPEGTRSDGRLSLESNRKGVTVRGPNRLRAF